MKPTSLPHNGWAKLVAPAIIGLSMGMGCAHTPSTSPRVAEHGQKIAALKSRLQEVERTNGRLNVRIEDLEDQIFLLQDMTESNRIALRRRGRMNRGRRIDGKRAEASAPKPTPESYYGYDSPYADTGPGTSEQPKERGHTVTRIQLSRQQAGDYGQPGADKSAAAPGGSERPEASGADDGGDEIVITEKQYRDFVGQPGSSSSAAASRKSSPTKAQPPVTDETLATTASGNDTSAKRSAGADTTKPTEAASDARPLAIYRAALANYRGGSYSEALAGFKRFLHANPNPNYLDNALYWIGECHYGLGDYGEATSFFKRVLSEQPDGNKVPDAMLKMSLAYERQGKAGRARELLEKLTDRYPSTNAGRLGGEKLSEMDSDS